MSILNPQNQNYNSTKHKKRRLNEDQVRLLEAHFDCDKKLEADRKLQLARELGVPPRQIAIWYQNKRARWRNQSLELDYNALGVRLETTLAEKRQLEKEVKHLQEELQKARDMLIAHKQQTLPVHPPLSSISSCCDEGGATSLYDDVSFSWVNGEQHLQLDTLYPCFVDGEGSTCGSHWQNDSVGYGINTTKL